MAIDEVKYKWLKEYAVDSLVHFLEFYEREGDGGSRGFSEVWADYIEVSKSNTSMVVLRDNEVIHLDVDIFAESLLYGLVPPKLRHMFSTTGYVGEYVSKTVLGMKSKSRFFHLVMRSFDLFSVS